MKKLKVFVLSAFTSIFLISCGKSVVPPKVNLDKFIKANKVVKMTGVVIDFSSIPVA